MRLETYGATWTKLRLGDGTKMHSDYGCDHENTSNHERVR